MPNLSPKQSENIRVDLHMHTTASDGTWRPAALIRKVLEADLDIFAVTDHDSTQNIDMTAVLAQENGLFFIPGVEVNTTYDNHNYHILGLEIDHTDNSLQLLLKKNKESFDALDDNIVRYLEKHYPCIYFDEYENYENNPERGGWKALNYTIDKKLCNNHRDFFKLIDGKNIYDRVILSTVEDAVQAITGAGGIPVLAHPGAAFYDPDYKSVISHMIHSGIRGIECFHPENSSEITQYCLGICKSRDLLITGGSDCHGDFLPNRRLGLPDVRLSQLNLVGLV